MSAYRRAMELYNRQRFCEAVGAFEEALRQLQDPSHPYGELARFYRVEAMVRSGLARERQGDLAGAERDLCGAAASKISYPDHHLHLGRIRARRGRFALALADLDAALRLHPAYAEARAWRAIVLWRMKRTDEALAELARLDEIRSDPGSCESPGQDVARAGALVEELEKQLIQRLESGFLLSEALEAYATGRRHEALMRLRAAVAAQPRYPDLRCRLGILLLEEGRCAEALVEFDEALAIHPRYVEALLQKGVALLRLDRPQEALASLTEVIRREPQYRDAVLLKALVELTRFRGHHFTCEGGGVHDTQEPPTVLPGAEAAAGRDGPCRPENRRSWRGSSSHRPRRSATG